MLFILASHVGLLYPNVLTIYAGEFGFRYSHDANLGTNNIEQTKAAISTMVGKRLTYNQVD